MRERGNKDRWKRVKREIPRYGGKEKWKDLKMWGNTLDFVCAFRVLQSVRMKCSTFSEENPYRQLLSPFYRRSASALLKNDSVKSY